MNSSPIRSFVVLTFALAAFAFGAGGCAKNSLERISDKETNLEQFQSRDQLRFDAAATAAQTTKGQRETVNVLALSGGGAWGAWGAGVLSGWRQSPIDPRPAQFDVVTGISTGALQATAAFIDDDEILRQGYTGVEQRDIMATRFPPYLSGLWSSSIYDTAPLAKLVSRLMTNDVIDRVAAHATGPNGEQRRLYVASCELDSGDLVFWNLTAIAQAKRYDLYRSVVFASAAIPAGFPPVHIGGKLHVDGGTRTSVFMNEAILKSLECNAADLRVYVIVNGRTVMDPVKPVNRTLPTAFRSVSMLLAAQAWSNLRDVDRLAREQKAVFWVSTVPDDYHTQAEHDFDQKEMRRLYEEGLRHGAENRWEYVRAKGAQPYFATKRLQEQMK